MAQYKVPQNVESEDKLLGPLTMKQFIYAIIGLAWGFLIWRILSPGGTAAIPIMLLLIVPISGFMLLLAFGRREEQSFENYLIALIRFNIVPRKRIWLKDDYKGEVIVDAPPPPKPTTPSKEDIAKVHSRLQQLSLVVDTRGHVKPADVQLPDQANTAAKFSERVFTPSELQKPFLEGGVEVNDDVLATTEAQAEQAQKVDELLQNKEYSIREEAMRKMTQAVNDPNIETNKSSQQNSQPEADNAILKKVMDAPHLSVAQVAQVANRDNQLSPGQVIQIQP
jgi:hypothetical protein